MEGLWRLPWDSYAIVDGCQAEMLAAVRVDQLPAIEQVRMSDTRVARHGELFLTAMWNVCRCYAGDELMDSSACLMERQYEAICGEFDITLDIRAEVGCARTAKSAITQIILEARARDDLRWIDSLDELRVDVAALNKPEVSGWLEVLFVGESMGGREVWRLNGDSYAVVPTEKAGLIPGLIRVDNLPSVERMEFSQCRVDYLVKAIASLNQHLLGHGSTSPIAKQLREHRAVHRRYLLHEIDQCLDLWLSGGAGENNVEDLVDHLILEGQVECRENLEPLISLQELDRLHEQQKELVVLKRRSLSKFIKTHNESCDPIIQESPYIPISETTLPVQESLISSQQDFPVTTPVASATVEVSMESTPSFGDKCSDVSASLNPGLSLWSNLAGLSIEDFEQSLPHSEWLDIQDAISNSYQQRSLGQCTDATGSLSCPTPTASAGEQSRPAGQTKCEEWWMNSGIIPNGLQLSAIAMCLLQGFPADYLNVVSPPLETIPEDSPLESSQGVPSLPPKQLSLLPELNILMAVSNLTNVEEVTEQIPTSKIARDGGTQSRASVNTEISKEYAEYYHSGIELPPIVVFHDGERYWLADGFHRLEAQLMVGRATVEAIVHQGVRRDAVLCVRFVG